MTPLIFTLMGQGLQKLLNGDVFGGLFYPVTSVLHEWTYAIGVGIIFMMLFFKTQSVVLPLTVFIILMPLVLWIIPAAAWPIVGVLVMLSIVGVLAKTFINKG